MLLGTGPVRASTTYPTHPIKLIVPFAAGGGTDVIARIFAARLGARVNQRVLVENHPGAGGNLGAALVAKADPDGYTILFTSQPPITIAPNFKRPLPYNPKTDLVAVAMLVKQPVLFAVKSNSPANDLKQFIKLAKSKPGKLNFGTPGVGTEMALTVDLLELKTGIQMVQLPYRSGGPAITALIRGDIAMMPVVPSSIEPYVKSGQVKILATTASKRLDAFPSVPTTKELGLPDINIQPWWGLFVPKGTPQDVVSKIESDSRAVSNDPIYQKRMKQISTDIDFMPSKEFKAMLDKQTALWGATIKKAHIELK